MRRNHSKTLATPNFHRFNVKGVHSWTQNINKYSPSCYLYMAVRLFLLVVLSFMILEETKDYRTNPTSTAVEDDVYPVRKVNFPAIGICNLNLISKEKLSKYARELWGQERVKRIQNLTVERLEHLLKYMGHLFTFARWEENPGDLKFLHHVLNVAHNNDYIMWRVMERLMPHCRESMEFCSWKGEIRSCEELFIPRWSPDGSCCTFNYLRWTDTINDDGKNDFAFHMEKSKFSTMSNGLRVYLDPRFDDNFYSILPARGYKVFVFIPTDYPDSASGSMREILLSPGTDNYLNLKGAAFYSSDDVKRFDKSKRQCVFNDELPHEYGDSYSYTQCLMLCRARDIVKTCGCVPFFYPYTEEMANVRDCHIVDTFCLRTYRYKWLSLKPPSRDIESEMDEGNLECDCLPSCEVVDFQVHHTGCEIHHDDIDLIDFVRNYHKGNVSSDSILLSINFGNPTIMRLKQDVMFYWYDLLSNYGGLCSLFLGVSILTPIEMIYEFSLRFWNQAKKSNKLSARDNLPTIIEPKKIKDQPIYWKEMMQQRISS